MKSFGGAESTNYDAFEEHIKKTRNHMFEILSELRRYLSHNLLDYANIICSACNPLESPYFTKNSENKWKIEINISNCSNFLDFFEYEMEVIRIFNKYLYPLSNAVTCNGTNEIELDDLDTSFLD